MSEPGPTPPLRIGTAERNAAMSALDEHMAAGRLDPMEYGERSAQVTEARTVADLRPLFVDLPPPHPDLPAVAGAPSAVTLTGASPATPAPPAASGLERWGPRIASVMPLIAVVLFFAVPIGHAWVFFLLIPLAGSLFARGGPHGHDHRRGHRHGRRTQRGDERDG